MSSTFCNISSWIVLDNWFPLAAPRPRLGIEWQFEHVAHKVYNVRIVRMVLNVYSVRHAHVQTVNFVHKVYYVFSVQASIQRFVTNWVTTKDRDNNPLRVCVVFRRVSPRWTQDEAETPIISHDNILLSQPHLTRCTTQKQTWINWVETSAQWLKS